MPDLFDNIYNKITTKFTGGHTTRHYSGTSQVNSGKFYNYHSTPNNNKYWLPTKKDDDKIDINKASMKDRSNSIGSIDNTSDMLNRSRFNSTATTESDL